MKYYSTELLRILIARKRLKRSLRILFPNDAASLYAFLLKVYYNKYYLNESVIENNLPLLLKNGLISEHNVQNSSRDCTLMFTDTINFELTYQCGMNCPHCLQAKLKLDVINQLSTEKVLETIFFAYALGLCSRGLNFTGGEVLGNRDDFFDIIEYVHSLKIPYRINTNSWWALKKNFTICHIKFSEPRELVSFLKANGLLLFAFSYDIRYNETNQNSDELIESIRLCEESEILYQIIFTGLESVQISQKLEKIKSKIGKQLKYCIPVRMEMVDVGNAADLSEHLFEKQTNRCACKRAGFYRPQILHINPYGDVRSCIYANGLNNVGNINRNSLINLINTFPESDTARIFSVEQNTIEAMANFVDPYLHLYRPIIHECTKMIVLAKAIDAYYKRPNIEIEKVHRQIAAEMNLLCE